MTIELVQELCREAGDTDYAAGMLANWLTGKESPPFDEAEVDRRRDARESDQADRAEGIRQRVQQAGQSRNAESLAWSTASYGTPG